MSLKLVKFLNIFLPGAGVVTADPPTPDSSAVWLSYVHPSAPLPNTWGVPLS